MVDMYMVDMYIESVMISPNPVQTGGQIKIEVNIYTLYPALDLYPALNLYPGADLFTLYPGADICPEVDIYPTEGGVET